MSQLQEQYRLLDLPVDASPSHLKQAYKDLVFVWHPDRFSGNPRLQKKAEEKLKCINLAYQQIRAEHRAQKNSKPYASSKTAHQTYHASRGQPHKQQYRQTHRQQTQPRTKTETSIDITLQQIQFIVSHFQFRPTKRGTLDHRIFKSGPFQLEIQPDQDWVKLENLCDSLNGFHPILLAIPCKASATFFGREGKEVIELFKRSQTQYSRL